MVTPLSTPFTIRHYVPHQDLHSLSQVLTEIESIDHDGEDTSEEYLRASLQWPNYRPDQDVWVAEANGELVGYALALEQPSRQCTLYVVVHTSQRRKGLGTQLLDQVLLRAKELGSKTLLISANERNTAANLFLKQHGFESVGSSGTMRAPDTVDHHPVVWPTGFKLQPYSDINRPIVLLTALRDCYLDMWGHQHRDQFPEEELVSPNFLKYYEPEDILLLIDPQGDVVGLCSVKSEGKRDETGNKVDLLDAPGVIKKYRQKGYQRQLVLAGMDHLREKAVRPIILEFWGESEEALGIYWTLGFEMLNRYITYRKELE